MTLSRAIRTRGAATQPVAIRHPLRFTAGADGRPHLHVTAPVPAALVAAYQAAEAGDRQRARDLLDETLLTEIERRCHQAGCSPQLPYVMADLYFLLKDWDAAEAWYRRTLEQEAHGLVYHQLGLIRLYRADMPGALALRRRAYASAPDWAPILSNHGTDRIRGLDPVGGVALLRRAADRTPDDPLAGSKLLYNLAYLPDADPEAVLAEHRCWAERFAPRTRAARNHRNDPDPERPLRIGYLSCEFRRHSAAYNLEPFLDGRDPARFQVFGYGDIGLPDRVTDRLAARFDVYRDIRGHDDLDVARRIAADAIDILVIVAGHTLGNRLAVAGYKPAPLQVDYGAVQTTGLSQIDYRLTDSLRDSAASEPLYTERCLYVPGGADCFAPPEAAPEVGPLPAAANGFVTFACFNNSSKINTSTLELWAEVLRALPDSRLLLKFRGGEDPWLRGRFEGALANRGVAGERVTYLDWQPADGHLALYREADIALDTWPFNGCTTGFEALWMGLPVMTLRGVPRSYWMSRMGAALMERAGLGPLVAGDEAAFRAKTLALARDVRSLETIRASLRSRLLTPGGLCDAQAYGQRIAAAYDWMWRQWCASRR